MENIKRFFATYGENVSNKYGMPSEWHGRIFKLYGGSAIELQLLSRFLVFMKRII